MGPVEAFGGQVAMISLACQAPANGDTTPSDSDDTDFGSLIVDGSAVEHTFTIEW